MTAPRLVTCGHCRADFVPRRSPCRAQRFCSRSCAGRARPPRSVSRGVPACTLARYVRLLEFSPFERRARGWRFGTKRIDDNIVANLVAAGRARIEADRLHLVEREARP